MTTQDTLLVEPCPRCGHAQTVLRRPASELLPTCICCGGSGLERDRRCRHFEPQPDLPIPS